MLSSARTTPATALRRWTKFSRCWKKSESVFSTFLTRSFMKVLSAVFLFFVLIGSNLQAFDQPGEDQAGKDNNKDKNKVQTESATISGFRDSAGEREVEKKFIAMPDPKLAEEHL